MSKGTNKYGFTLVELIVVIVILAVLAAISFMLVTKWINKSSNARAASDVGTITRALHGYFSEKGIYPETTNPIGVLSATGLLLGEQGIFDEEVIKSLGTFSKVPKDPKANDYYMYTVIKNPAKGFEVGAVFENPEISVLGTKVYADGAINAIPYIQSTYHGKYYNDSGVPIFPKPLSVFDQSSGRFLQESTIGLSGEVVIDLLLLTGKQMTSFSADGVMIGGEYGDFIVPKVGYEASGADSSFSTGVIMQALPQGITVVTSNGSVSSSSSLAVINGACGSANGEMFFDVVPSINLCAQGTNTPVSTVSTGYVWDCNGANGGINSNCSAGKELNKWTSKTSMPSPRQVAGFGTIGDKIYVLGGNGGAGATNTVYMYDVTNDTWSTKTSMPTAKRAAASATIGDNIYLIGGNGASVYSTVHAYNTINDTWTAKASMPTARWGAVAGVVNGKIYVIGGYNGTSAQSKVEMYDPDTNTWTTKTAMPTARYYPAFGVIGTKIYIAGGRNLTSGNDILEVYDTLTDTWSTKANLFSVRRLAAGQVVNDKLLILGGYNGTSVINSVNEYDPVANSWSTKTPLTIAKRYGAYGLVNNKIYFIGGYSGTNTISTVQEYGW